jgi:hypothetical protein
MFGNNDYSLNVQFSDVRVQNVCVLGVWTGGGVVSTPIPTSHRSYVNEDLDASMKKSQNEVGIHRTYWELVST